MALLTTEEIAAQLRLDESTIRRWCRSGILPALRVGRQYRVEEEDFKKFVAEREVTSTRKNGASLALAR